MGSYSNKSLIVFPPECALRIHGSDKYWNHFIKGRCTDLRCLVVKLRDHRYGTTRHLDYNTSGFGGLEVACWPLIPKFAGSHPAEAVGFLGPSFGGEIKPSVPCRSFTACKRSLNVTWKSAFRQNYRTFFAHSFTFRYWVLSRGDAWRRLVAKVKTSNTNRTISLEGCSV